MIARRSFLLGLVAAPLVVRAESLMRLRGLVLPPPLALRPPQVCIGPGLVMFRKSEDDPWTTLGLARNLGFQMPRDLEEGAAQFALVYPQEYET